jgi:hypothetical protein
LLRRFVGRRWMVYGFMAQGVSACHRVDWSYVMDRTPSGHRVAAFFKNVKAPLCFDGLEAGDEFCGGLGRTVEQLGLPLGILGMLLEPGTNVMK